MKTTTSLPVVLALLLTAFTPKARGEVEPSPASTVIEAAIGRGAPLYNDGDVTGCVAVYEAAARMLLRSSDLGDLHRLDLERLNETPAEVDTDRAWELRRLFDQILDDEAFTPVIEAPSPDGFPAAGPVGRVVVKAYPSYRAARASGGNSFWTLFRHIKKNEVKMTSPVEMTMDADSMRPIDMAFLYEMPVEGSAGEQGRVSVLDLEATTVLSIGMRGGRSGKAVARAKAAIERRVEADGYEIAGSWRLMGYNSPMVRGDKRFWELQVPVTR